MALLYDFSAQSLTGKKLDLAQYRGKVVLVVNTASRCGLTPQYASLEALQRRFRDRGLEILGFPCNQFGAQEPGSADEIGSFCEKNYGVSFQMFDKIEVNGAGAHPLYRWFTETTPGPSGAPIKWNFTKFLVGSDGSVARRFEPQTEPGDITADIETLLESK